MTADEIGADVEVAAGTGVGAGAPAAGRELAVDSLKEEGVGWGGEGREIGATVSAAEVEPVLRFVRAAMVWKSKE